MCENGKVRSVKNIPGMEGRVKKENDGGGVLNSTVIYHKNFW
jgi:hypothetical protein